MQQVMRSLNVTRAPSWLANKRHLYPSIDDFEVATEEECEDYWTQTAGEETQDFAVSAASDDLGRLSTNNGPCALDPAHPCANSC